MDKVIEILKCIKPGVDCTASNALIDEGILDSMDIVLIISEIETEYSIEINPDEIDPDNFQSVSKIHEMIKRTVNLLKYR